MISSRTESCLLVFLFSLGFFVNYGITQSADGSSCQTPDKINGKCIDLIQCQPMVSLVSSLKRPYSTKITTQLNAYKCGNGATVKVCCPPGPINLDPLVSNPPDVTRHKNINLLPSTCGYLDTSQRIVNGKDAALNEFPWMALLQYRSAVSGLLVNLCGGTIIHKNYILTAAHCLTELKATTKLVGVRVGEHSIKNETDCEIQEDKAMTNKCNPPVQDLKIEEIIPHPQFGGRSGNTINDIGLIRVSTINLEVENARPVCLPIGIVRDRPFANVIVTGWGVSDITTGESSDILQKVSLKVADKATCVKNYAAADKTLIYSQICVGGDSNKDSCSGDSGGPMVVPTALSEENFIYVQQGIVSYGPKACGISGFPAVYTLVKYYMDWILDTMRP